MVIGFNNIFLVSSMYTFVIDFGSKLGNDKGLEWSKRKKCISLCNALSILNLYCPISFIIKKRLLMV